jgi:predicted aspartyl protease
MKFNLARDIDSNLFLVKIKIDDFYNLKMILDTACSNTTIDVNALHLLGYDFPKTEKITLIETANGIVETKIFVVEKFSSLGIIRDNFEIQVYDFLAHGIFSDYDGLLGLDFLEGLDFCINTKEDTIRINF